MTEPIRISVEPRKVWFRGLYSGQFSTRGVVIEESHWRGDVEYGVSVYEVLDIAGAWHIFRHPQGN